MRPNDKTETVILAYDTHSACLYPIAGYLLCMKSVNLMLLIFLFTFPILSQSADSSTLRQEHFLSALHEGQTIQLDEVQMGYRIVIFPDMRPELKTLYRVLQVEMEGKSNGFVVIGVGDQFQRIIPAHWIQEIKVVKSSVAAPKNP